MLKSYESIADRELRVERAYRVEKLEARPVIIRLREFLKRSQ
jgi:hypothetical protein